MEEGQTFDPDRDVEMKEAEGRGSKQKGPSVEQITAIKAAIQNAETLEEVKQLEAALKSGVMPSQIQQTVQLDDQMVTDVDERN